MHTRILTRGIATLGVAAVLIPAAGAAAANAPKPVQRCGSIADPHSEERITVDIAEGVAIDCDAARGVMRTYLRKVTLPRTPGRNRTFKQAGQTWNCYVSRSLGTGPGWDYLCLNGKTSASKYSAVGGNLRR